MKSQGSNCFDPAPAAIYFTILETPPLAIEGPAAGGRIRQQAQVDARTAVGEWLSGYQAKDTGPGHRARLPTHVMKPRLLALLL